MNGWKIRNRNLLRFPYNKEPPYIYRPMILQPFAIRSHAHGIQADYCTDHCAMDGRDFM